MTNHEALFQEASLAGLLAGSAHKPTPMVVQQRESAYDDASPVVQSWHVPEGPCGFAWVSVSPGTSSFARWLKKQGHARTDSYYGGVRISISEYGQSYERKVAHAEAMALVFKKHGVSAYAMSNLD